MGERGGGGGGGLIGSCLSPGVQLVSQGFVIGKAYPR